MNAFDPSFAPILTRFAGLTVEQLDFFGNDLRNRYCEIERLEGRLADLRQDLVDHCHRAVHGEEDKGLRRRLLAVKRACYNGRELAPHWQARGFGMETAAARLGEEIIALESELSRARGRWVEEIVDQYRREQQDLVGLLDDGPFRCGLAVAAADVADRMDRLRALPAERYGRKERRLAETLLRYASRAAFKTSPFSTFTSLALGELTGDADCSGLERTDSGDLEIRSLVRLRRHWLHRLEPLLLRYEPLEACVRVEINDSLQELGAERYRWMRPSRWKVDHEGRRLTFEDEGLVSSRLRPELVRCLRDAFADGPSALRELREHLQDRFGEAGSKAPSRLLDIGFLMPVWPWSIHQAHLEKAVLRRLEQLPRTEGLAELVDCLREVVSLEDGLLHSPSPTRDRARLETLMEPLIDKAAAMVGLGTYDVTRRHSRNDVYQDVWYGGDRTVTRLSKASAARAVESVVPLMRYTRIFDLRVDFLYSLGSLLQEHFVPGTPVPFLTVCDLGLPMWRDYIAFRNTPEGTTDFVFNPRQLPLLQELLGHRNTAPEMLSSFSRVTARGQEFDEAGLVSWLDSLPARFTDPLAGPGLFLQPADREGKLWVLNRLKEGTGRFASRSTSVMPAAIRRRYLDAWRSRSRRTVEGEEALFLDVQCIRGDTLNVHEPQAALTLLLPGQDAEVEEESERSLSDLFVHVGADGWPVLRDHTGRRCLPVHLGTGYTDYMPLLLRMLCAFGPSELKGWFPEYLTRKQGEVEVTERTLLGNVVLHRRSWSVDTSELAAEVQGASVGDRFQVVHRWHRKIGLPRRVFVSEPSRHDVAGEVYQPQYLDFDSPSFVELFCGMLSFGRLTLTEMLPEPHDYPRDSKGRRRAGEILLDAAILNPPILENTGERADRIPMPSLPPNINLSSEGMDLSSTCSSLDPSSPGRIAESIRPS